MSELIERLEMVLAAGIIVELYKEGETLCADLNTAAKSSCVLKEENGGVFAHRRYGRVDRVECFEDIVAYVHDCAHGRYFFNLKWLEIFEREGLTDPRGPF